MKVILYIIFLCLPSSILAQGFVGGITGGFAATQVDGDRYGGYDKAVVIGGVVVKYPLNEKTYIQTEIKYHPMGSAAYANKKIGGYAVYKMKLNYIHLPFTLQYNFNININNKDVKLIAEAGLGLSYLVNAKEYNDLGYENLNPVSWKKYAIPGIIGISYMINENLMLSVKHLYSLVSMRNGITGGFYSPIYGKFFKSGQYNNVLSTSLYFYFK